MTELVIAATQIFAMATNQISNNRDSIALSLLRMIMRDGVHNKTDRDASPATRKSSYLNSALSWIWTSPNSAFCQELLRGAKILQKHWPEVEEAEGGNGSEEKASQDHWVGSPSHQLTPPQEETFQAERGIVQQRFLSTIMNWWWHTCRSQAD